MARGPIDISLKPSETNARRLAELEEREYPVATKILGGGGEGPEGKEGKTGAEGPEGHGPGVLYTYLTNTESTEPGSGKLKFGGALGVNGTMRISKTDKDGNSVGGWLESWDDNAEKPHGFMFMRKRGAPGTFILFKFGLSITTITDNTTWFLMQEFAKIGGSATGFANNDEVFVEFFAAGPKGEKGEKGSQGLTGEASGFKYLYNGKVEKAESLLFSLNNSTPSLATKIYLASVPIGGQNIKSYLETFDDTGTASERGYLIIRDLVESKYFGIYKITNNAESEAGGVRLTGAWLTGTEFAAPGLLHEHSIEFYRGGAAGEKGEKGEKGSTGEKGESGEGSWTPVTDSSIKSLGAGSWQKVTNVEGDATLRSSQGYVNGCFVTFTANTVNKGLGIGLNTDPATDEGFPGIDYWLNLTAAGTVIIRESGTEKLSGPTYVKGDQFTITYDGATVRYYQNSTLLREVARPLGSALYMDSWWNQEGGQVDALQFGAMGSRGAPDGLAYTYSTTTTEANPGKGFFRLNNATIASATTMYISRYMLPEVAIKGLINSWDDSTSSVKGFLFLRKVGDPSTFAAFSMTGAVTEKEAGEYLAVTGLTNTISNGTFANSDPVTVEFHPTGEKGEKGEKGSTGEKGENAFVALYRDIWQREGIFPSAQAVGTYILGNTALVAKETNSLVIGGYHYVNLEDYAVPGKTTKFRIKGHFSTNATAPGGNVWVASLRKVTAVKGAAGGITHTLGTALLVSQTISAPGKEETIEVVSKTPAALEKGLYALVWELASAAVNASAVVSTGLRLQVINE